MKTKKKKEKIDIDDAIKNKTPEDVLATREEIVKYLYDQYQILISIPQLDSLIEQYAFPIIRFANTIISKKEPIDKWIEAVRKNEIKSKKYYKHLLSVFHHSRIERKMRNKAIEEGGSFHRDGIVRKTIRNEGKEVTVKIDTYNELSDFVRGLRKWRSKYVADEFFRLADFLLARGFRARTVKSFFNKLNVLLEYELKPRKKLRINKIKGTLHLKCGKGALKEIDEE